VIKQPHRVTVEDEFETMLEEIRRPPSRRRQIPVIDVDGLPDEQFRVLLNEYVRVMRDVGKHIATYPAEGNFVTNTNAPDSVVRPADRVWIMQVRNRLHKNRHP
jgi:hypothetical protein